MEQAFTCFMLTCMDSIFYYTGALGRLWLTENWLCTLKCFLDLDFFNFILIMYVYYIKKSSQWQIV